MSFEAFAWAARQRVTSTQKLVLLMLAERHNKDTGQCRPSHDTLAEDCGLTRRSVIDQIGKLAQAGYITVLPRAKDNLRLPNQYRLNFHFGIQAAPKAPEDDPYLVVNDVHHPVVNQVHPVVTGMERWRWALCATTACLGGWQTATHRNMHGRSTTMVHASLMRC